MSVEDWSKTTWVQFLKHLRVIIKKITNSWKCSLSLRAGGVSCKMSGQRNIQRRNCFS